MSNKLPNKIFFLSKIEIEAYCILCKNHSFPLFKKTNGKIKYKLKNSFRKKCWEKKVSVLETMLNFQSLKM